MSTLSWAGAVQYRAPRYVPLEKAYRREISMSLGIKVPSCPQSGGCLVQPHVGRIGSPFWAGRTRTGENSPPWGLTDHAVLLAPPFATLPAPALLTGRGSTGSSTHPTTLRSPACPEVKATEQPIFFRTVGGFAAGTRSGRPKQNGSGHALAATPVSAYPKCKVNQCFPDCTPNCYPPWRPQTPDSRFG